MVSVIVKIDVCESQLIFSFDLKNFLLVVLLSGCALSAPLHSVHRRDVSHLSPPATSYGVPEQRISAPYPPPAPVQEYGPPRNDEPIPAEPAQEYGPPANEYLPPPPAPAVESLPEVVVSHPYPPPADPVSEYGPPAAAQQDFVAPVQEYGLPAQDSVQSVVSGPYPAAIDSRYGAPTH